LTFQNIKLFNPVIQILVAEECNILTKSGRILLVDDDKAVLESFSIILQEEGYSVDVAKTGKEAIQKTNDHFYNVAIIDWRLPDISGTDLLTELHETVPKITKILLTGYPSMKNAIDAVNNHADAFLIKPVEANKLLNKIQELQKMQEEANNFSQLKVAEYIESRTKQALEAKKNNKSAADC
jgi:DNA-binding NtrC family response regulator